MWTPTEICSTPNHIKKPGFDACVLDCRAGITSTWPIAPICAPFTPSPAQVHTTTHCKFYWEQHLGTATPKAGPARLLSNSTFTCGTREKKINKKYWNTKVVYAYSSVSICGGSMWWIYRKWRRSCDPMGARMRNRKLGFPPFPPVLFFPVLFFLAYFFTVLFFPILFSHTFFPRTLFSYYCSSTVVQVPWLPVTPKGWKGVRMRNRK